ncbi:nicotinate-nucleotide adenylyltransferase [soil metagenome]
MKRIAFFGGSFDPVHSGHVAIGHALLEQFGLDEFVFIPAFHAPHKSRLKPTSAYDRYAMLCLVTLKEPQMSVSKMEVELPEKPYSVETLTRLNAELPNDQIFFVMGADSWMEIKTWRDWEKVLSLTNHIVMTRPGTRIDVSHVTDEIRSRIIDLRSGQSRPEPERGNLIFHSDLVNKDVSATEIRRKVREADTTWRADVPPEVAIYIEKYQIYN